MKLVEIKVKSNYNLELGITKEMYIVEDKDVRKVWEHQLHVLEKAKKTDIAHVNELVNSMKKVIKAYKEEVMENPQRKEFEIDDVLTYLYRNDDEGVYEFGSILEDARIEIKIKEIKMKQEEGITIIQEKEGEFVV